MSPCVKGTPRSLSLRSWPPNRRVAGNPNETETTGRQSLARSSGLTIQDPSSADTHPDQTIKPSVIIGATKIFSVNVGTAKIQIQFATYAPLWGRRIVRFHRFRDANSRGGRPGAGRNPRHRT